MFYDTLTDICKHRHTTPSAIAKKIGLGNSAATYWKRGAKPKHETILLICSALNCDPSIFVSSTQKTVFAELGTIYAGLNETGRTEAIKRLKELAQLPQYTEQEGGHV